MKAELLLSFVENNPVWELDASEVDRVFSALHTMMGTISEYDKSVVLGYRGIKLIMGDGQELRAYKRLVEVSSPGEIRMFLDFEREFETWLFQTSCDHIDQDEYNKLLIKEFV